MNNIEHSISNIKQEKGYQSTSKHLPYWVKNSYNITDNEFDDVKYKPFNGLYIYNSENSLNFSHQYDDFCISCYTIYFDESYEIILGYYYEL